MADDSVAEFRITEEKINQIDTIKKVFSENGLDGQLNEDQLVKVFGALSQEIPAEGVKQLFAVIDKDKSGSVNMHELFSYLFKMDEAREMALRHQGGLHNSVVFCRLRPMAGLGIGGAGHTAGEAVEMKLDGFDEESLQIVNRHEKLNFTFPKAVITPDKTQVETFEATMPQFMDAWLIKCYNVQLLAYGQSGTGKTHTMFGTRESLSNNEPHEDWGLFPRIVNQALREAAAVYQVYNGRWALTASAVEFYLGMAYDLLGGHTNVNIDGEGFPVGLAQRRITQVSDLVPFLDTVNSTRTMSKTKMNEGSSRSHCALILTLHQNDLDKNDMVSTTFTVVDMAGSERTSKTGAAFVAPTEAAAKMNGPKKPTAAEIQGMEGGMINFELTLLATEIVNATEAHSKKRRYIKPTGYSTTDTMKFIGRSLDGHSLLCMIVCISQAPQHGWETWFSCTYGEKLSKLKAPLKKMKLKDMKKEVTEAENAVKKAKKSVEDTKKGGAGQKKYLPLREATLRGAQDYLAIMQELATPL